jgi:hypothetical protein
MRWLMAIMVLAGLVWFVAGALRRSRERVTKEATGGNDGKT